MNPNVAGQIHGKLALCFDQEAAFVFLVQFPSRVTDISEIVSSCHKTSIKVA